MTSMARMAEEYTMLSLGSTSPESDLRARQITIGMLCEGGESGEGKRMALYQEVQYEHDDLALETPQQKTIASNGCIAVLERIRNSPVQLMFETKCVDLLAAYEIRGKGKIGELVCKYCRPFGYRFHPDTVLELAEYHAWMQMHPRNNDPPIDWNSIKIKSLLAKLIQDSDLEEILLGDYPARRPSERSFLFMNIYKIARLESYGLNNPRMACLCWEVQDLTLLGDRIGKQVTKARQLREKAKSLLLEEDKKKTKTGESQEKSESAPITKHPKIRQHMGSPMAKHNAKISKFFSVLKKTTPPAQEQRSAGDYFQPFFVKPTVTMAKINPLEGAFALDRNVSMMMEEDQFWRVFSQNFFHLAEAKRRKRCHCLGVDSRPVRLVIKLLQFHTNYHPAYYGSWRRASLTVRPRRPFAKDHQIDYEYDSDEDWGEDEDIADAESITESDDEEEESVEMEGGGKGGEEEEGDNGWLVPDGYISDDEGLDQQGDDSLGKTALSRKRQLQETPPSSAITPSTIKQPPRSSKRRYVEKCPIIYGPYIFPNGTQSFAELPLCIQNIHVTLMGMAIQEGDREGDNDNDGGWNPFAGLTLPSETNTMLSYEEMDKAARCPFPEEHLVDLVKLIKGTAFGVAKLYDLFCAAHGRCSRRQFELKINQIAIKTKTEGRMAWTIRPEHLHLLTDLQSSPAE